ncbi:MAG: hypothetical protein OHK0021_08420 [Bryobacter sp.]
MPVVGVVQVAVHQIVNVVAVRYRNVSATGTVDMVRGVAGTSVAFCAIRWIGARHFQRVLVIVAFVGVVQVAVVQVVHVVCVHNGLVAAAGAVNMFVFFVNGMTHVFFAFFNLGVGLLSVAWARALKIRPTTWWSAKE